MSETPSTSRRPGWPDLAALCGLALVCWGGEALAEGLGRLFAGALLLGLALAKGVADAVR